ncbi:MAG: glycerophosphodiester phosphodiesterase [Planctomycetes bacterium]|nr:glycerophosphodiester phosphodiesterase [Planctomycetota bacterium]
MMKKILLLISIFIFGMNAIAGEKIIIAHRGASGYLPEHTLEAAAMAHAMGADYIEPDVVLSKDGIPVVLHDIHLDTVTNVARVFPDRKRTDGRYYALDFTVKELKQLEVTERFSPKTGKAIYPSRFPISQSSFQIPTMEEEIQLVQGLNKSTRKNVGIYPEIKAPSWHKKQGFDSSKAILEVLYKYGYRTNNDKCFVQCFEFDEVKRLRTELKWQGKLIQLTGEKDSLLEPMGLREVARFADGIGPPLQVIISGNSQETLKITDFVKTAHAAGLKVHPYTIRLDTLPKYVSSAQELFKLYLVDANVDGIFTDFPDEGAKFLANYHTQNSNK